MSKLEQVQCQELLYDFNATRPSQKDRRKELLAQMFAQIGEDCQIEPPLYADWGGKHVYMGKGVRAGVNLTLVDTEPIHIGGHVTFECDRPFRNHDRGKCSDRRRQCGD